MKNFPSTNNQINYKLGGSYKSQNVLVNHNIIMYEKKKKLFF